MFFSLVGLAYPCAYLGNATSTAVLVDNYPLPNSQERVDKLSWIQFKHEPNPSKVSGA